MMDAVAAATTATAASSGGEAVAGQHVQLREADQLQWSLLLCAVSCEHLCQADHHLRPFNSRALFTKQVATSCPELSTTLIIAIQLAQLLPAHFTPPKCWPCAPAPARPCAASA